MHAAGSLEKFGEEVQCAHESMMAIPYRLQKSIDISVTSAELFYHIFLVFFYSSISVTEMEAFRGLSAMSRL